MGKKPKKAVTDPLQIFGNNVREIRGSQGLSLRGLATMCNLDHSGIARIEKGQKNITILTILELAKGLQVHPKELFDLDFGLED